MFGSEFGSTPGQLLVNGMSAPFSVWSDTEIVGYVPVGVPSGAATLEVSNSSGASDPFPFIIDVCAPLSNRLSWRQRFDALYTHARPIVGPDGTIYVLDVRYRLYAIHPQGRVKWVVNGSLVANIGPDTPIFGNTAVDVGADGTLYSGHKWYVSALEPDGTLRWRFDIDTAQRSYIVYDTKVGPGGNIYVAASHTPTADALGVYSLTPQGDLRWNVAHPYDRTTRKQIDLVFGPGPDGDQLYFSANQNSYALNLDDGDITFNNLSQVTGFAAISPIDGTVHSSNYAYQADGTIDWQSPIFLNGAMAIDTQGMHYATTSMVTPRIVALNPDGSVDYETVLNLPSGTSPETTTATPDDAQLLVHDIFNRLLALNSANGAEDWRIELSPEEGRPFYWLRRPAFSASGATAYYLAAVNAGGIIRERTFLYAITLNVQPPGQPIYVHAISPSIAGIEYPTLHFTDPNPPDQVTGYNIYRSSDPTMPPITWTLIASDVADGDPATPAIQWTDDSGDLAPSGIWHYHVTAYNGQIPAEGPF